MRGGNKAIVRNELLAILWQGHDAHWEVWGHFSSHHPTRRKHLLMLLLWYLLIPIAPILFDHYCLIWSPCYLSLRLLKQIPNSSPFSSSSAELATVLFWLLYRAWRSSLHAISTDSLPYQDTNPSEIWRKPWTFPAEKRHQNAMFHTQFQALYCPSSDQS